MGQVRSPAPYINIPAPQVSSGPQLSWPVKQSQLKYWSIESLQQDHFLRSKLVAGNPSEETLKGSLREGFYINQSTHF